MCVRNVTFVPCSIYQIKCQMVVASIIVTVTKHMYDKINLIKAFKLCFSDNQKLFLSLLIKEMISARGTPWT